MNKTTAAEPSAEQLSFNSVCNLGSSWDELALLNKPIKLKADKQLIRFYPKEKQFTNNKLQLQTNEIFIHFPMVLQTNSIPDKKHTINRFKKLLFDIAPNKLQKNITIC